MIEEFQLKNGKIVVIKYLTIQDCELNNNYESMHSWLNQVSHYMTRDYRPEDLEQDKKKYYKMLSKPEESVVIGAISNSKIIGHCKLYNRRRPKVRHLGKWAIAIHPSFQRQGLGTRMLEIMEQIAMNRGLKKLEASFIDGNKVAENLYLRKMNYTIEGCKRMAILTGGGKYKDVISIGKILDDSR